LGGLVVRPLFLEQLPMRIKKINDLKNTYRPYAPNWSTWIKNFSCSLDAFDLYVMEILIRNGFETVDEELSKFCYQIELTRRLIRKLGNTRQLISYENIFINYRNKKYVYEEDG